MRAMDGRIVRCGIISSCQSAAALKIVKRSTLALSSSHIGSNKRYSKCRTLSWLLPSRCRKLCRYLAHVENATKKGDAKLGNFGLAVEMLTLCISDIVLETETFSGFCGHIAIRKCCDFV